MALKSEILTAIDNAIEESGLSARKVSEMATGKPHAIKNLRKGFFPRIDTLEALCDVLGLALTLKHEQDIVEEALERSKKYSAGMPASVYRKVEELSAPERTADNDDYINLPLMDIRAAAGAGKTVEYEVIQNELSFRRDWLAKMGLFPRNLSLITAEGKSMEPDIQDGDVLLVNRADRNPAPGKVMVAFIDDHLVVKELLKSNGTWALISKNLEYGFTILDDINALIGHVVWRGGKIN